MAELKRKKENGIILITLCQLSLSERRKTLVGKVMQWSGEMGR